MIPKYFSTYTAHTIISTIFLIFLSAPLGASPLKPHNVHLPIEPGAHPRPYVALVTEMLQDLKGNQSTSAPQETGPQTQEGAREDGFFTVNATGVHADVDVMFDHLEVGFSIFAEGAAKPCACEPAWVHAQELLDIFLTLPEHTTPYRDPLYATCTASSDTFATLFLHRSPKQCCALDSAQTGRTLSLDHIMDVLEGYAIKGSLRAIEQLSYFYQQIWEVKQATQFLHLGTQLRKEILGQPPHEDDLCDPFTQAQRRCDAPLFVNAALIKKGSVWENGLGAYTLLLMWGIPLHPIMKLRQEFQSILATPGAEDYHRPALEKALTQNDTRIAGRLLKAAKLPPQDATHLKSDMAWLAHHACACGLLPPYQLWPAKDNSELWLKQFWKPKERRYLETGIERIWTTHSLEAERRLDPIIIAKLFNEEVRSYLSMGQKKKLRQKYRPQDLEIHPRLKEELLAAYPTEDYSHELRLAHAKRGKAAAQEETPVPHVVPRHAAQGRVQKYLWTATREPVHAAAGKSPNTPDLAEKLDGSLPEASPQGDPSQERPAQKKKKRKMLQVLGKHWAEKMAAKAARTIDTGKKELRALRKAAQGDLAEVLERHALRPHFRQYVHIQKAKEPQKNLRLDWVHIKPIGAKDDACHVIYFAKLNERRTKKAREVQIDFLDELSDANSALHEILTETLDADTGLWDVTIGKPERLKHHDGIYAYRLSHQDRLVLSRNIDDDDTVTLTIYGVLSHYR